MTDMYTPKPPCPVNLGWWFCVECRAVNLDRASNTDYPLTYDQMKKCWRQFGDRICGNHLGYTLCEECQKDGKARSHINEFVAVGTITDEAEFSSYLPGGLGDD